MEVFQSCSIRLLGEYIVYVIGAGGSQVITENKRDNELWQASEPWINPFTWRGLVYHNSLDCSISSSRLSG